MLHWPRHSNSEEFTRARQGRREFLSCLNSRALGGGKIVEPQYKWQPVTDFYKEQQATQTVDPAAETQQKLQEIQEEAKKTSRVEKKGPHSDHDLWLVSDLPCGCLFAPAADHRLITASRCFKAAGGRYRAKPAVPCCARTTRAAAGDVQTIRIQPRCRV